MRNRSLENFFSFLSLPTQVHSNSHKIGPLARARLVRSSGFCDSKVHRSAGPIFKNSLVAFSHCDPVESG